MIDEIDSSESTLRLLASRELKNWNDSAVVRLLKDDDYVVRTLVARELQLRGTEEIFPALKKLLGHKKDFIREIAIFALGQFGTPKMPFKEQSLEPIVNALKNDTSSEVRAAAADALGRLSYSGMPAFVENSLCDFIADPDDLVRAYVAVALGSASNSTNAHDALHVLLSDKEESVRDAAKFGLELLAE